MAKEASPTFGNRISENSTESLLDDVDATNTIEPVNDRKSVELEAMINKMLADFASDNRNMNGIKSNLPALKFLLGKDFWDNAQDLFNTKSDYMAWIRLHVRVFRPCIIDLGYQGKENKRLGRVCFEFTSRFGGYK